MMKALKRSLPDDFLKDFPQGDLNTRMVEYIKELHKLCIYLNRSGWEVPEVVFLPNDSPVPFDAKEAGWTEFKIYWHLTVPTKICWTALDATGVFTHREQTITENQIVCVRKYLYEAGFEVAEREMRREQVQAYLENKLKKNTVESLLEATMKRLRWLGF